MDAKLECGGRGVKVDRELIIGVAMTEVGASKVTYPEQRAPLIGHNVELGQFRGQRQCGGQDLHPKERAIRCARKQLVGVGPIEDTICTGRQVPGAPIVRVGIDDAVPTPVVQGRVFPDPAIIAQADEDLA